MPHSVRGVHLWREKQTHTAFEFKRVDIDIFQDSLVDLPRCDVRLFSSLLRGDSAGLTSVLLVGSMCAASKNSFLPVMRHDASPPITSSRKRTARDALEAARSRLQYVSQHLILGTCSDAWPLLDLVSDDSSVCAVARRASFPREASFGCLSLERRTSIRRSEQGMRQRPQNFGLTIEGHENIRACALLSIERKGLAFDTALKLTRLVDEKADRSADAPGPRGHPRSLAQIRMADGSVQLQRMFRGSRSQSAVHGAMCFSVGCRPVH